MTDKLWLDTEAYSTVDIKRGTYAYMEGAELLILTWAVNDEPVNLWDVTTGDPCPAEVYDFMFRRDCEIWAHNSTFDRLVLQKRFKKTLNIGCWHDTALMARENGLPGALGQLTSILLDGKGKLDTGKSLIKLFCVPQKDGSRILPVDRPKEWEEFKKYALADVDTMRKVFNILPKVNYPNNDTELLLHTIDQSINDRGFRLDTDLIDSMLHAVSAESDRLDRKTQADTGGAITSTRQRDATLAYILETYGVSVKDLTKATVTKLLGDPDLDPGLRDMLETRQQASATATAKYSAAKNIMSSDGRLRGSLVFCGATRTGRDSGRGFQPQNLPSRGILSNSEIDDGIDYARLGCADLSPYDVTKLAKSAVRRILIPSEGHQLVVSDLANIEGRVAAWLAGEDWKLKAFRDLDKGEGMDLYTLSYAKAFQVNPESVTKGQRDIGKVMELMLQYMGGVGAFVTGANSYGFDMDDLAAKVIPTLPGDVLTGAENFLEFAYKKAIPRHGLSDKAFVAADALKRLWRRAHPGIVGLWRAIKEGVVRLQITSRVGINEHLTLLRRGNEWFGIRLPSSRVLMYYKPMWGSKKGLLSYMGIDTYTKEFTRINTYEGKLFENICQAVARDVLFHAMPRIEADGYKILLRVHDEIVAETKQRGDVAEKLSTLMSQGETWTEGLPLAAKGDVVASYRKI